MRKLSTLLTIAVFLMAGFSQFVTGSETITNHLKQKIETSL